MYEFIARDQIRNEPFTGVKTTNTHFYCTIQSVEYMIQFIW